MFTCIEPSRAVRFLVVALILASSSAVTGCTGGAESTGDGAASKVASLATATTDKAGPTPRPSASSDNERPYFRPDMTDDEVIRLSNLYEVCLKNHGVPVLVSGTQVKSEDDGSTKYAGARKACAGKKAEQYEERLAREDPEGYQDFLRAEVACIRAAGLKASIDASGKDFHIDPKTPLAESMQVGTECNRKAYALTK